MSDQLIVERGGLEKKEKGELQAIILALGGTSTARARKSELIDQIMELSGATGLMDAPAPAEPEQLTTESLVPPAEPTAGSDAAASDSGDGDGDADDDDDDHDDDGADGHHDDDADDDSDDDDDGDDSDDDDDDADDADDAVGSNWVAETEEIDTSAETRVLSGRDPRPARASQARGSERTPRGDQGRAGGERSPRGDQGRPDDRANRAERADRSDQGGRPDDRSRNEERGNRNDRTDRNRNDRSRSEDRANRNDHPTGPDGEPLADWELAMLADGNQAGGGQNRGNDRPEGDDVDPNNRRSRRRGRGRGREREEAAFEAIAADPIPVAGVLDLRDEGYGFLRVDGCLPSKDDVYVSVKQVRQYGLRKGDILTGLSRPASRNEKNPGFHQIDTVNDLPAEEGRNRVRFDDLTPLFPDERLRLEMREEPLNMTTRIIDLVAPIGKGQRALIVSPPKAGKTTVIKDIARAIETNNPEVQLIVLLLDERPEEVTDMTRHLERGHVVASTFDRPPEEHCAVAELTIERAKRMVEAGQDVCLIVDGITRLSRAYNLTAPPTGRAMSGGLDAAALYPPKRFFGAARNLEEGGSLTILATALVDTGSRMDEVIFEEFKGTGNCEIRLDRRLAEKRLYPAIDVDGSSTRHEELLFDRQQLQAAWKLRRVLSAMKADDGSSAAAVEMLVDRLKTFKTNADFLNEIAKSPSL